LNKLATLTLAVLACTAPSPAQTTAQAGAAFTLPQRQEALVRAETALGSYFHTDRIAALRAVINANRQTLLQIADQRVFAATLTSELQDASHDRHIIVWYSDAPDANRSVQITSHESESDRKFFLHIDYGFNAAVRLLGNIGYLSLGGFANMPEAKASLDAAMTLMAPTDALIIDLRRDASMQSISDDEMSG